MFNINQHMKDTDKLCSIVSKIEPYNININKDILLRDKTMFECELSKAKNRNNIANIKAIIKYLDKILSKLDSGKLEMCWDNKNDIVKSYPLELKVIEEYNVNTCEYVELHNEKLVTFDFENIMNIMAFEYIHRDFGYSHEDTEKILYNCGIAGIIETEIFDNFFKKESIRPYNLGKHSKIEDCQYISKEKHKIKNYFSSRDYSYKNKFYSEVLVDNARTITSLIVSDMLKKNNSSSDEVKIIMVSEKLIALTVDNKSDLNIYDLITDISIRFFGRQFNVRPKITIL